MSITKEFKSFAMRGNVVDLAVGIIIGGAFGKIVDSLVKDVIMPPLGLLLKNIDFTNYYVVLREASTTPGPYTSLDAATKAGALTLNLGLFLNTLVSFLIVAWAVFLMVKAMNTLRRQEEVKPVEEKVQSDEAKLLSEIRDLLRKS